MKTTILFTYLFYLSINASALTFTVVNGSFDQTTSIEQGSEQFVDVTISGGYTSSDRLRLFIHHDNGTSSGSNTLELINEQFSVYYFTLPENSDGSRRITFTLPTTYTPGSFFVSVNLNPSKHYGILDEIPTAIISRTEAIAKFNTSFYTVTGIRTTPTIEGFYIMVSGPIRELVYIKD